jgi:hypothetical protein
MRQTASGHDLQVDLYMQVGVFDRLATIANLTAGGVPVCDQQLNRLMVSGHQFLSW